MRMIRSNDWAARSRLAGLCLSALGLLSVCRATPIPATGRLVQIGSMHEAIGKRQHEARVDVAEVASRPHFYGVGALEGLEGEITVLGSVAVVTRVTPDGALQAATAPDAKATLLVGQSVERWTRQSLTEAVSHERFDESIGARAGGTGVETADPFVFVIEGAFTDVRLHVINGACPIHARINQLEIAEGERPFELEAENVSGTLVGVYAAGAVGRLTHPATKTHAHLIYTDPATGERVTGHVERAGVAEGAVLKLPAGRPAPANGSSTKSGTAGRPRSQTRDTHTRGTER
jgi:alpha-acetolactate decarboxylase